MRGKPFPFDRARILARHRVDWNDYLDAFWADGPIAEAKKQIAANLKYMESMPLITRDNIRHRAVPVAEGGIAVDGKLDDSAWARAEPLYLTLRSADGTRKLLARTAVRLLWSDKHLYLGFECSDERITEMQYGTAGKTAIEGAAIAQLWNESSLELFLNPSGDRTAYYQLLVDPAGSLEDASIVIREGARNFDWTWRSGAAVAAAAAVGDKAWTAEIAIPFAALNLAPDSGKALVANFARNRHIRGDATAAQLTTWSPLIHGNHDLERFGTIVLGEAKVRPLTSFEGGADVPGLLLTAPCRFAVSSDKASDGAHALRVEFPSSSGHQGVTLRVGDAGDWSGFAALLADVYLEGGAPWEALTTLVTTAGARHHHGFKLQPGWNRRIAISAFLPDWRLDAVDHVCFYGYNHQPDAPPRVLFLDNLRLLER